MENSKRVCVTPTRRRCHILGYMIQGYAICVLLPAYIQSQEYFPSYVFRQVDEPRATSNKFGYHSWIQSSDNTNRYFVDKDSQCQCREYLTRDFSTCYDDVNCKSFPRNANFTFLTLSISTTAIVSLRRGDLAYRNSHLQNFMLYGNDKFEAIEPGAFEGMTALRNLSIYNNLRLKHLDPDSFKGLMKLDVLFMMANSFVSFSDITVALHPQSVPVLRIFKLSKLYVTNVTQADFEPLKDTPLQVLCISTCKIKYLDPNILIPLRSLQSLSVRDNKLSMQNLFALVRNIVKLNRNIEHLNISNTGLRSVPTRLLEEIEQTNITHLTLSDNYFESIEQFPRMTKIKYLDLRGVSALKIDDYAFAEMPKLETLFLDKNGLIEVPGAVNLTSLLNLDISDNTVDAFSLSFKPFTNMHHLRYLNMSMNSIRVIRNVMFDGLRNLRALDLENSRIFTADNGTFSSLRNLQFLKLRNNQFPSRYMHPALYNGLIRLEVLILSHCTISEIREDQNIFTEMPNLQYLLLDNNDLVSLAPYLFQNLTKLKLLDISVNKIMTWTIRLFPANNHLETLIASYNMFRRLSRAMVEDFSKLKVLDVRVNSYTCSCEEVGSERDVINQEVSLLLQTKTPFCAYPDEATSTSLQDYIANETIRNDCEEKLNSHDKFGLLFAIPTGLLTFVFCCVLILGYIFRWHLRYWLFLLRVGMNGSDSVKNSFACKKTYRYDAFVSYCNEDRNFVIRLVAMLENYDPPLKLCVYERDFEIGTVISQSVLESVADSRRTLLVISEAYIKSQWCRWEVQVAENHRLFFEDEYGRCVNDTLVMVKLGDISQARISPMLCYLMKTRIYLQWDPDPNLQREFWIKLRKFLKPPGRLVKHRLFRL